MAMKDLDYSCLKTEGPNAILTGSRVYGTPHKRSDVDLVVLMEPGSAMALAFLMGVQETGRYGPTQYPIIQFKAGGLNVLIETDPERFDVWIRGTEQLKKEAPVTRERALELFDKLRAELTEKQSKRAAKIFDL